MYVRIAMSRLRQRIHELYLVWPSTFKDSSIQVYSVIMVFILHHYSIITVFIVHFNLHDTYSS